MATVTGFTAERSQDIEDQAIIDGSVVGDNLILERNNGETVNAGNVRGAAGLDGDDGVDGGDGWSPVFSIVNDGVRRVIQVVDWVGGTGTEPSSTNVYVGPTGFVSSAAAAVDVRGATGADGDDGLNGWSPVFSLASDGDRRVLQIVDWTGGSGSEPSSTNQFIGPTGIVGTAAAAVDVRGPSGPAGTDGVDPHPIVVAEYGTVNPASYPNDTLFFEWA